jgi:hypothetical protein
MPEVILSQIQCEVNQHHCTRVGIIEALEKKFKRRMVAFFTSFYYPASVFDQDAEMLESLLQKTDLKNGLTLLLSSAGGSGLAAERIVNVCRTYSKGDFEVLVPGQAKSAATIICFGANRVLMSKTSELGPIDPQVTLKESGEYKLFSVYDILDSYQSLFERATQTKGNLEPFIAQLEHYDEREISKFRRQVELSEDIAIKLLKLSMMKGLSDSKIKEKIKIFLFPTETKVHGRPIFIDEAKKVGLRIKEISNESPTWQGVQEYAARLNYLTSSQYLKILESCEHHFCSPIPKEMRK